MDSIRLNKVSRLVQKELAEIFQLQARKLGGKVMITVTAVKVTKDLSFARVYLSIFGVDDKPGLVETIKHNHQEIRRELGFRLKNQLRTIPAMEFFNDDSLDYIENIDNLLKQ